MGSTPSQKLTNELWLQAVILWKNYIRDLVILDSSLPEIPPLVFSHLEKFATIIKTMYDETMDKIEIECVKITQKQTEIAQKIIPNYAIIKQSENGKTATYMAHVLWVSAHDGGTCASCVCDVWMVAYKSDASYTVVYKRWELQRDLEHEMDYRKDWQNLKDVSDILWDMSTLLNDVEALYKQPRAVETLTSENPKFKDFIKIGNVEDALLFLRGRSVSFDGIERYWVSKYGTHFQKIFWKKTIALVKAEQGFSLRSWVFKRIGFSERLGRS